MERRMPLRHVPQSVVEYRQFVQDCEVFNDKGGSFEEQKARFIDLLRRMYDFYKKIMGILAGDEGGHRVNPLSKAFWPFGMDNQMFRWADFGTEEDYLVEYINGEFDEVSSIYLQTSEYEVGYKEVELPNGSLERSFECHAREYYGHHDEYEVNIDSQYEGMLYRLEYDKLMDECARLMDMVKYKPDGPGYHEAKSEFMALQKQ